MFLCTMFNDMVMCKYGHVNSYEVDVLFLFNLITANLLIAENINGVGIFWR